MEHRPFERYGAVIRKFLHNPRHQRAFSDFFDLCFRHTKSYLRCLHGRGYQLPIEHKENTDPFKDLTFDILGFFLASPGGEPFPLIFTYFEKECPATDREEPENIYHRFTNLLTGFIHQQLSKLSGSSNPQLHYLKRRFKDIITSSSEYTTVLEQKTKYVFLTKNRDNVRSDQPLIPYERLQNLAVEAYFESATRAGWCRKIFELLDEMTEYQNRLAKHELLAAVITANSLYVNDFLSPFRSPLTPEEVFELTRFETAIEHTAERLQSDVVQKFVKKEKITAVEAKKFVTAAKTYLSDMVFSGETDPLPHYFREVTPPSSHQRYAAEYKYVFETIISKAVNIFGEEIKK